MQAAAASEAGLVEKTDGGRVLHGAFWRGRAVCFFQRRMNGTGWMRHLVLPFFLRRGGIAFAAVFRASGTHPEETADFLGKGAGASATGRLFAGGLSAYPQKALWGQLLRQLDTPQKLCFGQLAWARMDATAIDLLTCIKTMRQEEAEKMLKEGFSKENMVLSDCEIKRMPSIRLSGGQFFYCAAKVNFSAGKTERLILRGGCYKIILICRKIGRKNYREKRDFYA